MGICCSKKDSEGNPAVVWFPDFVDALPAMQGKRVAITGTTTGTGYIAAEVCARKGAEVVLLNRDSTRATEAVKALRSSCPNAVFVSIPCDLQDFASVRTVKAAFESHFGASAALDVLACNAGVMAFPDKPTKDGFDVQMHTNHLSHFLLVKELLPNLKVAATEHGEARIVNHTSGARNGGPLEAKYLCKNGEGNLGGDATAACFERYHQSKLANAVFTLALEAKLARAGLTAIKPVFCTPGLAATGLVGNLETSGTNPGCIFGAIFGCMNSILCQSGPDGTMPLLHSMFGAQIQPGDLVRPSKGPGGETYGPPKVSRRPLEKKDDVCVDPKSQDMLWTQSEAAIGESFEIVAQA